MVDFAREVLPVNLEDEMRRSYLDYAMSVIVGRALPDVRDGLKPVHRRVLFAMRELGTEWNRSYKKSARIVGDVIGKYHPHGETAVYDTIVRLAQPFTMRYLLIDGQGNFGSVDGDAPAAMRYTEVRMSRIAQALLADLDLETVDFAPNYDDSEREPTVLPTRLPNLLVNGATGIAVGMATNIPPHNLTEVINACVALIDVPTLDIDALMQHLPAPDLPTAGFIHGLDGIREAYRTGRGRLVMRARHVLEGEENKPVIVVTELPFQVNKARLLERIAELVKEKKIEGISELRDESDKDGMRMVIELKRGELAEVVLNNLYQHTALQSVFGINMVALVDAQPRLLNLKDMLEAFLRHRREVVTRRTVYELRKARERAHVLEGLAVALANIDPIIALIKAAESPAAAKAAMLAQPWAPGIVVDLLERAGAADTRLDTLAPGLGLTPEGYRLSEVQVGAILDLRLHRLTGLEQEKIRGEYVELLARGGELAAILADPSRLMQVIRAELLEIREQYGDARRSEIVQNHAFLSRADLITPEDVVITLSHAGYAKAQPLADYAAQRRGGRGRIATSVREEDFVERVLVANTHDTVLCFSSMGKVYWLKGYDFPQAGRTARGRPIVNLLPLVEGERINAILPVRDFAVERYVFMATASGIVKKTPLADFSRPRGIGIIAVDLRVDDRLVDVALTDGSQDILLFSDSGQAARFSETDVRAMGRGACGVRGMRSQADEQIIAMIIDGPGSVLTATEFGFGKRTALADYPRHGRGGQGVISIKTTERNGRVVGAVRVEDGDEIMLISKTGILVRTPVAGISLIGRNTQGVKLIALAAGEKLVGIERVANLGADAAVNEATEAESDAGNAPDPSNGEEPSGPQEPQE